MPRDALPAPTEAFGIRPLDPIGVEILGLDLREPISESVFATLRETIVREGLVLFREQPMTAEAQIALGRRFGPLENTSLDLGELDASKIQLANVDETGRLRESHELEMRLVAINEGWHTDGSFRAVPAAFSLFAAVTVPPEGGDTFFASLERAWEALSPEERAPLYGVRGLHDYERAYAIREVDLGDFFGGEAPSATHPLVRRHPESGRSGLFVSEHVFELEGVPEKEVRPLLDRLMAVSTDPGRVYRHRWSVGDLLIWDNRSMLHRAQGFDPRHPRVMRHVRVAGEGPALPATP